MSEPTHQPDELDRLNAEFWRPKTLQELVAGVAPRRADESFEIPDLTDEEWDAFMRAINE